VKIDSFIVFLDGNPEIVKFYENMTPSDVKKSLIELHGYSARIKVYRECIWNQIDEITKIHLTTDT
jgi:hypothetical protein